MGGRASETQRGSQVQGIRGEAFKMHWEKGVRERIKTLQQSLKCFNLPNQFNLKGAVANQVCICWWALALPTLSWNSALKVQVYSTSLVLLPPLSLSRTVVRQDTLLTSF